MEEMKRSLSPSLSDSACCCCPIRSLAVENPSPTRGNVAAIIKSQFVSTNYRLDPTGGYKFLEQFLAAKSVSGFVWPEAVFRYRCKVSSYGIYSLLYALHMCQYNL